MNTQELALMIDHSRLHPSTTEDELLSFCDVVNRHNYVRQEAWQHHFFAVSFTRSVSDSASFAWSSGSMCRPSSLLD